MLNRKSKLLGFLALGFLAVSQTWCRAGAAPKQELEKETGVEHHSSWQDSPRPWSALPVEVRESLKQGRPRFSEQITDSPFGTHLWVMAQDHDTDRIPFVLDGVAATGMKWIRDGVYAEMRPGETVEQARDRWKNLTQLRLESSYESAVAYCKAAKARGIRILALIKIDGLPNKVTGSGERGRRALVELCKIIVPALKDWIKDWEIDNEPNPEIPPAEYVAAVRAAYKTIKGIDPEARVYAGVVSSLECLVPAAQGGLEPYPDPNSCYIDGLLEAGLLDVCDVFSFHPYRKPTNIARFPEKGSQYRERKRWRDYTAQIQDLKLRLKKAAGRDFPIANTEFGFPTHFDAQTDQRNKSLEVQAKCALRASIMDHHLGIYPSINFYFRSEHMRGAYVPESHYGMIDADWMRQPKYYAYTGLCAILESSDKPLDMPIRLLAPRESDTVPVYFCPFHRKGDDLVIQVWKRAGSGRLVLEESRKQVVEMVTIAFWRAVPASDEGAVVPIDIELTLPDEHYGYPILLDPRNLFATPFKPLAYRQRGNRYVLAGLPASDSPVMARFFKIPRSPR